MPCGWAWKSAPGSRPGNWANGITGQFDLILANPPYIGTGEALRAEVRDHEPATALFAGPDGLDDYRIIVPQLPRLIAPGGVAILEIGSTQAAAVTALLVAQGLSVTLRRDLGNNPPRWSRLELSTIRHNIFLEIALPAAIERSRGTRFHHNRLKTGCCPPPSSCSRCRPATVAGTFRQ